MSDLGMPLRARFPRALFGLMKWFGIDRAVAYMIFGRFWSTLAGPLTIFFVATQLSQAEQGYYYTFFSIAGLTSFFELGLSGVIVQFASHEKAYLHWDTDGTFQGDRRAKERLSSLLRSAVLWYGLAAVLAIVAVGAGGYWFFRTQSSGRVLVSWECPWVLVVVATAVSLALNPWYAILEGIGFVREIAQIRFWQGVVGQIGIWTVLVAGMGLFAAASINLAGIVCGVFYLAVKRRAILRDLWASRPDGFAINWWVEVWPLQWRMGLACLGVYFASQVFTPVLFAYRGEREAGQWGMSFTLVGAVMSVASFWIYAKAPSFGTFVAKREFGELDRLFFRTLWQSLAVSTLGLLALCVGVFLLGNIQSRWAERLLPPLPFCLLTFAALVSNIVMAQAFYLRAHKQDPFFGVYLALSALVALIAFVFGRAFGAAGLAAGYFLTYLVVGLVGGTVVFAMNRRKWHNTQDYRPNPVDDNCHTSAESSAIRI